MSESTPESTSKVEPALKKRIASLDQFRGYTVAGMFLVNFMGSFAACPVVMKHHHTYLSYADTIMPHFLFAVGFAFRLTFGRRASQQGLGSAYFRVIRRFLGLVLFSMIFYGAGRPAETWEQLSQMQLWEILYKPMKREWLQTLGHIAITSLWITPVIRASAMVRIIYMVASGLAHVFLSYKFHYIWVQSGGSGIDGGPLGFLTWTIPAITGTLVCDAVVGAVNKPNLKKLVAYSVLMMGLGYIFSCGTMFYRMDEQGVEHYKTVVVKENAEARKKIADRLSEVEEELAPYEQKIAEAKAGKQKLEKETIRERYEELHSQDQYKNWTQAELADKIENDLKSDSDYQAKTGEFESVIESVESDSAYVSLVEKARGVRYELNHHPSPKLAKDPVWPSKERREGKTLSDLIAEPPFVKPPADDKRITDPPQIDHFYWNYWMITQRGGSLSYLTISAGLSIFVYVLFYICCDMWGWSIGVFRVFGSNALAAYIAHEMVGAGVKPFIPRDSPDWYAWAGFVVFFSIVYLFIRHLEKNKIFLRL